MHPLRSKTVHLVTLVPAADAALLKHAGGPHFVGVRQGQGNLVAANSTIMIKIQ